MKKKIMKKDIINDIFFSLIKLSPLTVSIKIGSELLDTDISARYAKDGELLVLINKNSTKKIDANTIAMFSINEILIEFELQIQEETDTAFIIKKPEFLTISFDNTSQNYKQSKEENYKNLLLENHFLPINIFKNTFTFKSILNNKINHELKIKKQTAIIDEMLNNHNFKYCVLYQKSNLYNTGLNSNIYKFINNKNNFLYQKLSVLECTTHKIIPTRINSFTSSLVCTNEEFIDFCNILKNKIELHCFSNKYNVFKVLGNNSIAAYICYDTDNMYYNEIINNSCILYITDKTIDISAIINYTIAKAKNYYRNLNKKTFLLCLKDENAISLELKGIVIHQVEQLIFDFEGLSTYKKILLTMYKSFNKYYPLSYSQQLIWNTQKIYPRTNLCYISGTEVIKSNIDFNLLKEAINICIEKNDAIRIKILETCDGVLQYISPYTYYEPEYLNFSEKRYCELEEWINNKTKEYYDINDTDLFYFAVIKVNDTTYRFFMKLHHLISDTWSTAFLIASEVIELYFTLKNKISISRDIKISYIDYIRNESDFLLTDKFLKSRDFWTEILREVPEFISFKNKSKLINITAKRKTFSLPINVSQKILHYCNKINISVFNLFLSSLFIYINKITSKEDIVIGTPTLNRTNIKEKETVGVFINIIPIRLIINPNSRFSSFLQNVSKSLITYFRHQKYPYELIQESFRKLHKTTSNLCDVMLSFQNAKLNTQKFEAEVESIWHFNESQTESLIIHINDRDNKGTFMLDFDYLTDSFNEKEICELFEHLLNLIIDGINNDNKRLTELEFLSLEEKNILTHNFDDNFIPLPNDVTIVDLFEKQVEQYANKFAIVYKDTKISYFVLNQMANSVANKLKALGISVGQNVAVLVDRTPNLVQIMLGILKSGATYLPVDKELPLERIEFILKDSNASILITDNNTKFNIKSLLTIDIINTNLTDTNPNVNIAPCNTAYIIYTSGTTGTPKGVIIPHKGIVNLNMFFKNNLKISNSDNILQFANISFDASLWEIFMAILNGATLYIVPSETIQNYLNFEMFLNNNKISILTLPPTYLNNLNPENIHTILKLIVAGSDSNVNTFLKWQKKVEYINAYGPTETSICATTWSSNENMFNNSIPIGKAITNTKVFILNKYNNLLPIGFEGEIVISGPGLSYGYINNAELTNQKFIELPFLPGQKAYRTGDIGILSEDLNIKFLGRVDTQIKIRGFRVELGEIESNINNFPGIKDACVVLKNHDNNQKSLVAFIVCDNYFNDKLLKDQLKRNLPPYMIPSSFIKIDNIPVNNRGKLDRDSLIKNDYIKNLQKEYIKPSTYIEKTIITMLEDILNIKNISITSDFFEIGVDSIVAISLLLKIEQKFNIKIEFSDIYNNPNIFLLSKFILSKEKNPDYSIEKTKKSELYPISSAQKRIYLSSTINKNSINYNAPGAILIEGEVDNLKFENSLRKIIERHEALRTGFIIKDGALYQKIFDIEQINFHVDFLEKKLTNKFINKFITPFCFETPPLFRASLLKQSKDRYIFLLDIHHIISDGASIEIFIKELFYIYNEIPLPEQTFQYKDFSAWQNKFLEKDIVKKQSKYWMDKFEGDIPKLNLPLDFQRTPELSTGDRIRFKLNKNLTEELHKFSTENKVTLFVSLLSIYNVFLSKYTMQNDIIVATASSGRHYKSVDNIIGMFVNTIAMRNFPENEKTFISFLKEVKENTILAFENQDYQFDELIKDLDIERELGENPLFGTMFVLQKITFPSNSNTTIRFKRFDISHKISKFDLLLMAEERYSEIHFEFEYKTKLFKKSTIKRMSECFLELLKNILTNPTQKIGTIEILSSKMKNTLINKFNNTNMSYPKNMTIHQLFEEQVNMTPFNISIYENNKHISYDMLNKKANAIALMIKKFNLKKESVIALMIDRSIDMVIGMIGILKSGSCILGIDPNLPDKRIKIMLEESNTKLLITNKECDKNFKISKILIDKTLKTVENIRASNINRSDDLLYIVYTSGTTGVPKGVMMEHKNLINLIYFQKNKTSIIFDKVTQMASLSFDVIYQEIFSTLLSGGELHIINEETKKDIFKLFKYIDKYNINTVFLPTSYFKFIISEKEYINKISKSLTHIIVAGEQLILNHDFKDFIKNRNINLHNHYGPSESHVVTTSTIDKSINILDIPDIGKPISNTSIYILNSDFMLAPIGVFGELAISGDSVGRGYINAPELTKQKFIKNPFKDYEKLYKTGDLARWLPNGNIEFLGRIDSQVKINGYRIELSEIEITLSKHQLIKEAAVIAYKNSNQLTTLCGFIILKEDLSINEIQNYLASILPSYMIPSKFVFVNEFPKNTSSKIDKFALAKLIPTEQVKASSVTVINPRQKQMLDILKSVLLGDNVGINDNFFEIGGDSLNALKFAYNANKCDIGISPQDVYKFKTIKAMLDNLDKTSEKHKYKYLRYNDNNSINQNINLRYVMLTGATGFLGSHILNELLEQTNANIYCLVRGCSLEYCKEKFRNVLKYYFDNNYINLLDKRIFIVNGDITLEKFGMSEKIYNQLGENIDCVIHSAALVKHYGEEEEFEKINIYGTKNIVNFVKKFDKKLEHISTIGICGKGLNQKNKKANFTENDLFVGQNIDDNIYIKSKFEAEKIIYDELYKNNSNLSIYRVGNLTGRSKDGKFQINKKDNAFYNTLSQFLKIGVMPEELLNKELEFTPVDICSKAIVKLITNNASNKNVFHLFNNNKITVHDFVETLNNLGISIKILTGYSLNNYLEYLKTLNLDVGMFSNYIKIYSEDSAVNIDCSKTKKFLNMLAFEWGKIDKNYLEYQILNNLV